MVVDAGEVEPADARKLDVAGPAADLGVGGDECEAARQLAAKEIRRRRPIRLPPRGRFADLPLGVRDNP